MGAYADLALLRALPARMPYQGNGLLIDMKGDGLVQPHKGLTYVYQWTFRLDTVSVAILSV